MGRLLQSALAVAFVVLGGLVLPAATTTGQAAVGPSVTFACSPAPEDCTGWYRTNVTVRWTVDANAVNTDGCNTRTLTADTQGAAVFCNAQSPAGQWTKIELAIKVDKTAPNVTGAIPDRKPDANGWYNHPLRIAYEGADATSGIDVCTVLSYSGPDSAKGSVSGSCRDRAGNESSPTGFALKYDSTAPALKVAASRVGRAVVLSWRASQDTSLVTVARSAGPRGSPATVYRGRGRQFRDTRVRQGVQYRYTVTAVDDANNPTVRTVGARTALARKVAGALAPRAGVRVKAAPLLRWRPVRGAAYYNVQLFRGGKILSAWPRRPRLQLRRTWIFAGRRHALAPGRYRWFVWPGYGSPSASRYGKLIGHSSFVVRR